MLAFYLYSISLIYSKYRSSHIINFTSLLLIDVNSSNLSEFNKEPFSHYVNRVNSEYTNKLGLTNSDVKVKEILHSH